MFGLKEERINKLLRIVSILAIPCCCVLLFPQVQNLIVKTTEIFLGHELVNPNMWMEPIKNYLFGAVLCFTAILLTTFKDIQDFLEKNKNNRENIFTIASIVIIILSIIVRIIMYAKVRSLWVDEALLAENFVTRNCSELLNRH